MTNHTFQYAVLKYRPSILLNEAVNIGMFFCFDNGRVVFIKTQNWARLKAFSPKADIRLIRIYLNAFEKKATKLQHHGSFLDNTAAEIWENEFLVTDSNSLQISEFKVGRTSSIENTIAYYSETFFPPIGAEKKRIYKSEDWISNSFAKIIKEKDQEKLHFFQQNRKVQVRGAVAEFDYVWQNGTENLVKPLGFDLLDRDSILDKGNLWLGKLLNLKDTIQKNNQKIDFLVSGPDKKQTKLFDAFEEAVDNLDKFDFPKKIYRENQFPSYVDYALENFKLPLN